MCICRLQANLVVIHKMTKTYSKLKNELCNSILTREAAGGFDVRVLEFQVIVSNKLAKIKI